MPSTGSDGIVDQIGELPPVMHSVLEFISEPGENATFVVVAGAASPTDFFDAVLDFVTVHIPIERVMISHIPASCEVYSHIAFIDGELMFCQG
jgi:hypothetical protein